MMKRSLLIALSLALFVLPIGAAVAEDVVVEGRPDSVGAGRPAEETPEWEAERRRIVAEARKKAAANAPKVGDRRVFLRLEKGGRIEGYLRVLEPEMFVNRTFKVAKDPDHPKAGLRVWYTSGTNGFIFIPKVRIVKMEIRYTVTADHRRDVMDKLTRLHVTAIASRLRAQEELAELKAKQTAARRTKAESELADAADAKARKKDSADSSMADLLRKYPPTKWTPKLKEKILWNQRILGLAPSQKEKEWLDSYDTWKTAYDVWKKAADERVGRDADSTSNEGG